MPWFLLQIQLAFVFEIWNAFCCVFCLLSFSTFKRYIRSWSDEIWNKPPSISSLSLTSHPCPEQPMSSYCHIVFPFLRISSVKASTTLWHNFPLAKYVLSCVFSMFDCQDIVITIRVIFDNQIQKWTFLNKGGCQVSEWYLISLPLPVLKL